VALSDPADFEGGGTYFEENDTTMVLQQGEMIVHLGSLKHSGVAITSGVRHILVAFMSCNWN
jgi:predicted 2-oxoglutarate/Fe(II)-dependent dioxygenase YbiX